MKKFILASMVILMSACTLGKAVTPKQKVSEFLDKYKNENTDIIAQLDETIDSEISNSDHKSKYKTLMINQYKNMEYEIKDEIIEDDNAVVEVEITVYDYASALKNSDKYLNEHIDEFKKDNDDSKTTISETEEDVKDAANNTKNAVENAAEDTKDAVKDTVDKAKDTVDDAKNTIEGNNANLDYDEDKFMEYKLSSMEKVKDTVKYTIEFTLTKVNGEWQLDPLSNTDIEKLHGIYIS